jgi:hypothetical protein
MQYRKQKEVLNNIARKRVISKIKGNDLAGVTRCA